LNASEITRHQVVVIALSYHVYFMTWYCVSTCFMTKAAAQALTLILEVP